MADITLSLVTPTPSFEMVDNMLYKSYLAFEEGKGAEAGIDADAVSTAAIRTWKSLAAPDVDHSSTAIIGMLSDKFMTALDEQTVAYFRPVAYSIATDAEEYQTAFKDYTSAVYDVIKEYIMEKPLSTASERNVQATIQRKLAWIFCKHKSHYQQPLPLLTKSLLPFLVSGFEDVDCALREVSSFVLFLDHHHVSMFDDPVVSD